MRTPVHFPRFWVPGRWGWYVNPIWLAIFFAISTAVIFGTPLAPVAFVLMAWPFFLGLVLLQTWVSPPLGEYIDEFGYTPWFENLTTHVLIFFKRPERPELEVLRKLVRRRLLITYGVMLSTLLWWLALAAVAFLVRLIQHS